MDDKMYLNIHLTGKCKYTHVYLITTANQYIKNKPIDRQIKR